MTHPSSAKLAHARDSETMLIAVSYRLSSIVTGYSMWLNWRIHYKYPDTSKAHVLETHIFHRHHVRDQRIV